MKIFITTLLLSFICSANASVAVTNGDGLLTGINKVEINGELWDTSFSSVFSGIFYGAEFANAASQALLAAFEGSGDLSGTDFDHDYLKSDFNQFCESNNTCNYATAAQQAFFGPIEAVSFFNRNDLNSEIDSVGNFSVPTEAQNFIYLNWSPTTAVPVPAAFWLLGSGLIGLIGISKKSSK